MELSSPGNPRVPDAAIPVKVLLGSAPLLRKFGVPGVAGGSPLPPLPPSTKKKELPPELAKAQKAVEEAEVRSGSLLPYFFTVYYQK